MKTVHEIIFNNSQDMGKIETNSVNLVVTSPPYPMIEMWDETFSSMNPEIKDALESEDPNKSYKLMHQELNKIWQEVDRVLVDGSIVCINIGDATRKLGKEFQLFPNHSDIINYFQYMNYQMLPTILWRKQTNKPNKFMGSGMLPTSAYVTLEHEYILIFRKSGKRSFKPSEKDNRQASAYFWEERNNWFSDIWEDLKGTSQKMNKKGTDKKVRDRNGAYPFELAYRLINMYSVKNDTVLDPFLGTGTTTIASVASGRNSIGFEIDENLKEIIFDEIVASKDIANNRVQKRIQDHFNFIQQRKEKEKEFKHKSNVYNFEVVTSQEKQMKFILVESIQDLKRFNKFEVTYNHINKINNHSSELTLNEKKKAQSKLM